MSEASNKDLVHFEKQFDEVVQLIAKARIDALKSVNRELIQLYWKVGEYISNKIQKAEWGERIVSQLAVFIKTHHPEIKGFSDKNLWRMKQFYEVYRDSKLSALLRELSWTNNLLILSKSKTEGERGFYIKLTIQERYSSRELERQIDSGYYERTMLSKKVSAVPSQSKNVSTSLFKETYVLEFLNLPDSFGESDLRSSLIRNFRKFVLEFGGDFAFVGEEYRLQVGNNDYFIDLLFYHRELRCLVAFELKIDDFKPEYLGKLNFYLEALDRDVKKQHESPSVGVILCKSKDGEVVEYAMKRNMSPAKIAEYKTKLIPKRLLQHKIHEFFEFGGKDKTSGRS
jgi:predicted nuclease of restriction endonuclease-like (RecB) superfamily